MVAFNQQRTREVQSVWILHQRTKDVIQAGGGKMKDCRDEMSSLIVSLVSGGIHYIGTSLEEHDGRDGSKGNKRLLPVHRLIKAENRTTLTNSKIHALTVSQ